MYSKGNMLYRRVMARFYFAFKPIIKSDKKGCYSQVTNLEFMAVLRLSAIVCP